MRTDARFGCMGLVALMSSFCFSTAPALSQTPISPPRPAPCKATTCCPCRSRLRSKSCSNNTSLPSEISPALPQHSSGSAAVKTCTQNTDARTAPAIPPLVSTGCDDDLWIVAPPVAMTRGASLRMAARNRGSPHPAWSSQCRALRSRKTLHSWLSMSTTEARGLIFQRMFH